MQSQNKTFQQWFFFSFCNSLFEWNNETYFVREKLLSSTRKDFPTIVLEVKLFQKYFPFFPSNSQATHLLKCFFFRDVAQQANKLLFSSWLSEWFHLHRLTEWSEFFTRVDKALGKFIIRPKSCHNLTSLMNSIIINLESSVKNLEGYVRGRKQKLDAGKGWTGICTEKMSRSFMVFDIKHDLIENVATPILLH